MSASSMLTSGTGAEVCGEVDGRCESVSIGTGLLVSYKSETWREIYLQEVQAVVWLVHYCRIQQETLLLLA